ncbi:hypothetical protein A2V82_10690 [candidate division KSB1 bacterium RBG_16_48_16]|nr:MAG: hypothetical protein A2V82_10690 [candidate division KSB1 bacterium RBG_16_48_16]
MKRRTRKMIVVTKLKLYIVLGVSIIGFVVFFPFKVDDDNCCLGEAMSAAHPAHQQNHAHENMEQHKRDYHHLARQYVFPYGLLWWASILLGYWSVSRLYKERKADKHDLEATTHIHV